MHHQSMLTHLGTQYEEIHPAIMEECVRTAIQMDGQTDGLMDRTRSYISKFCLRQVGNNKEGYIIIIYRIADWAMNFYQIVA